MREYGDDSIKTMSGIEHYRFRPSMYGFQVSNVQGLFLQIKEILDNSADESNIHPDRTYTINVTFFVSKDKSTYQCLIQDFGRGIPVGKLVACLATANTSGKYEDKYGGESTGTNGVGSKVVAALSKQFIAFTKRRDGFASLEIAKGKIVNSTSTKKTLDKDASTDGTTIMFQPDPEIMLAIPEFFKQGGEEPNGFQQYVNGLGEYSLFHRNSLIIVRVVDGLVQQKDLKGEPGDVWKYLTNLNNFKTTEVFRSDLNQTPRSFIMKKFGIKEIIWDLGGPLIRDRDKNNEDDRLGYFVDIFTDPKSCAGEGGLVGAVNATPISDPNSIHLTMLNTVLKTYLEGFIIDEGQKNFFEIKYRLPISGYVSAVWLGATFDGQDKSKFTDKLFGDYYRSNIRRQLNKLPPSTWEVLYELIKEHFEMEYAKYTKTQYKMSKNLVGIGYMLKRTGSYIPCESKDPELIELIIMEGDSAAGRVKTVRNEQTQALFKLSGKPVNAVRADAKKLLKNVIYQDLMELIGVRPTDTDLANMRFKRIVILADADPDGYHIVSLLIGIIKEINPLILDDGRVQLANPPLYSYRVIGDKRPLYLRDPSALREAKSIIYRSLLDVYVKHKKDGRQVEELLPSKAYAGLCAIVEEVGDRVTFIANQLNIRPFVLEQLMFCFRYLDEGKPDTKMIRDILKDAGVDNVIFDKESNSVVLVIKGLEELIPLSHLKELLEKQLLPMYEKYCWRTFDMYVTTKHTDKFVHEPCSFMMLYQIFKSITGDENNKHFAITRFKGLGEMSEKDILGTCVDPTHRCTYTITGIGDVNVIYSMLGADSEARKQLSSNSVHGRLVDNGFLEE